MGDLRIMLEADDTAVMELKLGQYIKGDKGDKGETGDNGAEGAPGSLTPEDVALLQSYTDQAADSATAAAGSATAASNSAADAAASAASMGDSVSQAAASATAAQTSAQNAYNYATTALGAQGAAEGSQQAAEAAQAESEQARDQSQASQTAAKTSETNAAASAAAAAASQTAAKTSETNAKTSEINAAASAALCKPGGANQQVQFNDAGVFGAVSGFTYDKASNTLFVPNIATNLIKSDSLAVMPQAANGAAYLSLIPKGTGAFSQIQILNNAVSNNTAYFYMQLDTGAATLGTGANPGGTALPMQLGVRDGIALTLAQDKTATFGSAVRTSTPVAANNYEGFISRNSPGISFDGAQGHGAAFSAYVANAPHGSSSFAPCYKMQGQTTDLGYVHTTTLGIYRTGVGDHGAFAINVQGDGLPGPATWLFYASSAQLYCPGPILTPATITAQTDLVAGSVVRGQQFAMSAAGGAGGTLYVAQDSNAGGAVYYSRLDMSRTGSGTAQLQYANAYYFGGTLMGSITTNITGVQFNTTCDARLKNVRGPMPAAMDVLNQIKLYEGNFHATPDVTEWFPLAHEVKAIPELSGLVMGEKDAMEQAHDGPELLTMKDGSPLMRPAYQQLNTPGLIVWNTRGLQEHDAVIKAQSNQIERQQQMIDQLSERLVALENLH